MFIVRGPSELPLNDVTVPLEGETSLDFFVKLDCEIAVDQ